MTALAARPTLLVAGVAAALCLAVATWSATKHKTSSSAADSAHPTNHLVRALNHWDSGWYANIATHGYSYREGPQSSAAFFPLYPAAIWTVTRVGVTPYVAGILITLASGLTALWLFRKWATVVAGEPIAGESALLFALYPFAIYLYGIVYSDALFLLLVVAAFYFLERGNLVAAIAVGILATAARPVAPALVLGLLIRQAELQKKRGERWGIKTLLPGAAGFGLLGYMAFLWWQQGDPLAFAHAQVAKGWDNTPGYQTWLKFEWFRILSETTRPLIVARLGGHALATVTALALVWPTYRKLSAGYAVFAGIAVFLPALSSHDFQGLGRYVMAAFPLFVTATLLLRRRPMAQRLWIGFSAITMLLLAWSFGQGGYVA